MAKLLLAQMRSRKEQTRMAVIEFPNAAVLVDCSHRERNFKSLRACLVYLMDDVRALGLRDTATILEKALETADQEFTPG